MASSSTKEVKVEVEEISPEEAVAALQAQVNAVLEEFNALNVEEVPKEEHKEEEGADVVAEEEHNTITDLLEEVLAEFGEEEYDLREEAAWLVEQSWRLEDENAILREENAALKEENAALRQAREYLIYENARLSAQLGLGGNYMGYPYSYAPYGGASGGSEAGGEGSN